MNDQNPLPLISGADVNPVPVFSCHVILSKPNAAGQITGRCANLPEIVANGSNERDVLTAIMKTFKATVQRYSQQNQPVPFSNPADISCSDEVERFIPVHL